MHYTDKCESYAKSGKTHVGVKMCMRATFIYYVTPKYGIFDPLPPP